MTALSKVDWDKMIETKKYDLEVPDPLVIGHEAHWREIGATRVLDIGCGLGRHSLFLAQRGFEALSLDISIKALERTRQRLHEESQRAFLTHADMSALPFASQCVGAVIAWRVLHLSTRENIQKAFHEIWRILRPGGCLLASLRSTNNTLCHLGRRDGIEIEENTFIMKGQGLDGLIYHFFDQEETLGMLKGFHIIDMYELNLEHTQYTKKHENLRNAFWIVHTEKPSHR